MLAQNKMKAGDFTTLAQNYSKYRPGYAEHAISAILGVINKPSFNLNFVDVGAGTGIWTRLVSKRGFKNVIAIEPNDAMRNEGIIHPENYQIEWKNGSAENTGLKDNSVDFLTMASSFHWADFEIATKEFHRVLKENGHLCIVWNPRKIEVSPLLVDIENKITELAPNVKRVSSGKSKHVEEIADKLEKSPLFKDMVHIEASHKVNLSQTEYLGVWESVNDIRVQLGEDNFTQFISYIRNKIKDLIHIECTYQTRAWIVRK